MDIVDKEYASDNKLRREDVKSLKIWVDSQPHLPGMTEQEVIWFLKSCYYSNEMAKKTIDNFYTIRTQEREIFCARKAEKIKDRCNIALLIQLSSKTPEGDTIIYIYHKDKNPNNFDFIEQIKIFDSLVLLGLKLQGTHTGLRVILDIKNAVVGHVAKLGLMTMKKMLTYLQIAAPVRLKGVHFINIKPFMDMILAIASPFMKKELAEIIYMHNTMEDFAKYIPIECMPSDYGGKEESIAVLEEKMLKLLLENADFFEHLDTQLVDESKRPGKPSDISESYGISGTFKKLELD